MKQQTVLIEQPKSTVKPSQILKQAYFKGLKQCKNNFKKGDSYCARGAIAKFYGKMNGFEVDENYYSTLVFINESEGSGKLYELEDECFSLALYGKHPSELTASEKIKVHEIENDLTLYNDGSGCFSPNFLECAHFLEKQGL